MTQSFHVVDLNQEKKTCASVHCSCAKLKIFDLRFFFRFYWNIITLHSFCVCVYVMYVFFGKSTLFVL